jgi:DNA replication and repair protein RecF
VHLATLELRDFRCYELATLELPAGVVAVTGANGQGKTSLLEAAGWIALGRSFRGVPDSALVRQHTERAIVRAGVELGDRLRQTDVELRAVGRHRILVNGHPVTRTRDLLDGLRVTVFAPDDLQLVKGAPADRRGYLDELLTTSAPRYASVRSDFDRVLRHRNALLRGGVRDEEARTTLAVFDDQLVRTGGQLIRGRLRLLARLTPAVDEAYQHLAPEQGAIGATYEAEWSPDHPPQEDVIDTDLRAALERRHRQELDRGVTLVGPHRDEWRLTIGDRESRTHASQGEQRSLALALRLAAHRVVTDVIGDEPVLLLDDVFSELDDARSRALVAALPDQAQTVVTTAGALPTGVTPSLHVHVQAGRITVRRPAS